MDMDFKVLFDRSNIDRDKYLSRVFGIFSEEIVRIWCKHHSDYTNLGRPTIYTDKWHYTLDFTFRNEKTKEVYLVEMKSEMQYQNYKFMTLTNEYQPSHYLKHHLDKEAFKQFIDPGSHTIKINYIDKDQEKNKDIDIKNLERGSPILVWGRLSPNFDLEKFKAKSGINFKNILSVENMINDLREANDKDYNDFIQKYKSWSNDMFNQLSVKSPKFDANK